MKKTILLLVVFVLFGLGAGPGLADEPAGQTAEDYIIGPRDVLDIGVWGEPDMHILCEVSASGTINYFFLGDVHMAGLTLKQARDKLTALLADGYINNPIVIIALNSFKSKEVQINGAVRNSGSFVLETNDTTLLKLISMAGGTTDSRGNYALIYRGGAEKLNAEKAQQHPGAPAQEQGDTAGVSPAVKPITEPPPGLKGQEYIQADLRLLLDQGKPEYDITILPGDYVLIGSKDVENPVLNYVFVEGAVRSPRQVDYVEGMTTLQAITQAGGFGDVASPNRTYITRLGPDGKTTIRIRVKARDIQKGKRPDVPLKPGDRILVQESAF